MLELYAVTTTKAASRGYECAICNTTHSAEIWGVAYQLTDTGALYATTLTSINISAGSWICRKWYGRVESEINKKYSATTYTSQPMKMSIMTPLQHNIQSKSNVKTPDFLVLSADILVNFIRHTCCCTLCGWQDSLELDDCSCFGCDVILAFKCSNCNVRSLLHSSKKEKGRYELSKKLICASFVNGVQFSQVQKVFSLVGMSMYSSQNSVYSIADELWDYVSRVSEEVLKEQLQYLAAMKLCVHHGGSFFNLEHLKEGKISSQTLKIIDQQFQIPKEIMEHIFSFLSIDYIPLFTSIDGRWSKARNAMECTVILFEMMWHTPIYRYNIKRKRNDGEGNFVGSSKSAEGKGVDCIMDWIQQQKFLNAIPFEVVDFAHDHDGSTKNIIHKHFPNSKELLDTNHKAKNIKKSVAKVAKGWGAKVSVAFKVAVSMANNNSSVLKTILKAYVKHWCGDHDECYGNGEQCKNSKAKLDKEKDKFLIETLQKVFDELAEHSSRYMKSANTQANESFNNSICKLASKRYDFPKSYDGRVDTALMIKILGEEFLVDLFVGMGFNMSEYSKERMSRVEHKAGYDKKRKKSEEYTLQRKKLKENLKKIHTSVVHPEYKYKETQQTEYESQINEDNLPKKDNLAGKGVVGMCTCTGQCQRSCPCKKAKQTCTANCHSGRRCKN